MRCFYHPDSEAVNTCSRCGQPICTICNFVTGTRPICRNCWENKISAQNASTAVKSAKSTKSVEEAVEYVLQEQGPVEQFDWKTSTIPAEKVDENVIWPEQTPEEQSISEVPIEIVGKNEHEALQEQTSPEKLDWKTSTIPIEKVDENVIWPEQTLENQSGAEVLPETSEQVEQKLWQQQTPEEQSGSEVPIETVEKDEHEALQEQTPPAQLDFDKLGNQLEIPVVSESISTYIAEDDIKKDESIRCPLCGESLVYSPGSYWTRVLRSVMTTRRLVLLGILTALIGLFLGIVLVPPLFILIGLSGLFFVLIPRAPSIRAGLGTSYKCNSCNFAWTPEEIEDYKESVDE